MSSESRTMKDKLSKVLMLVFIMFVLIKGAEWFGYSIWSLFPWHSSWSQKAEESAESSLLPSPTLKREGMTEINQNSWNGVQCLQPNMWINCEILDPTIWWQVAFDGKTNDADIVNLYPAKHDQGDVLEVKTPHKRMDWRVHPDRNPKGTTAKVIWEIVPYR